MLLNDEQIIRCIWRCLKSTLACLAIDHGLAWLGFSKRSRTLQAVIIHISKRDSPVNYIRHIFSKMIKPPFPPFWMVNIYKYIAPSIFIRVMMNISRCYDEQIYTGHWAMFGNWHWLGFNKRIAPCKGSLFIFLKGDPPGNYIRHISSQIMIRGISSQSSSFAMCSFKHVKGILWDRRWSTPSIRIFFPHMLIFVTEMHF